MFIKRAPSWGSWAAGSAGRGRVGNCHLGAFTSASVILWDSRAKPHHLSGLEHSWVNPGLGEAGQDSLSWLRASCQSLDPSGHCRLIS